MVRETLAYIDLYSDCEFVLDLHKKFLEIFNNDNNNKPEVFSFIDTENTPVAFTSLKFIAYESAGMKLPYIIHQYSSIILSEI